ncbi:FUSC family protein [Streptomyces zingiberis]|uniref:FUSC family protein n=1 Tax=Streptomyces zingiberis TaxID=2053010 RepID=A0ABX1BYA1_9ACTN|nr:FUSC family protein [Streptomyces zingiberis]NJQ02640.1 FUSC family protein [Streptomyces zingiberis]
MSRTAHTSRIPHPRSPRPWLRSEATAALRAARRAARGPGRERDLAVQSLKAALAAVLAWLLSSWLLTDTLALMAPWVALVLVQATVYRSMARGAQQLAAIALGTVLGTLTLALLGHPVAAMAAVLPLTILIGNWPRFGDQGIYSATAALFTVTAGGEASAAIAGERVLAALLGAGVAVAVNALLRPPTYLRDTCKAVWNVVCEASRQLETIADGLEEPLERDRALGWYHRAQRLPRLIDGVRSSVAWTRESVWFHPEKEKRGEARRLAPWYDETLHTLDDVAGNLSALTGILLEAADGDSAVPRPAAGVTEPYAAFLREAAAVLRAYGEWVTHPDTGKEREELDARADRVRETHDRLRGELPRWATGDPEAVAFFGSLLRHARALTERLSPDQAGDHQT